MNLVFAWGGRGPRPSSHTSTHTLSVHTRLCTGSVSVGRGIYVLGEMRTEVGKPGWMVGVNVCCFLGGNNVPRGEVASQSSEFWLVCPSSVLW